MKYPTKNLRNMKTYIMTFNVEKYKSMGDTVKYSNMDMEISSTWVVLRLLFCAILLHGSCLHLFTSTFNLGYNTGTESGTHTLKHNYFNSSKSSKFCNLSK